jgi:hypothetical protein
MASGPRPFNATNGNQPKQQARQFVNHFKALLWHLLRLPYIHWTSLRGKCPDFSAFYAHQVVHAACLCDDAALKIAAVNSCESGQGVVS